jgi:hypothetical protein
MPKLLSLGILLAIFSAACCCCDPSKAAAPTTAPVTPAPPQPSETLRKIAALTPKDDARRDKFIQEQLNVGMIGDIEYRPTGATATVGDRFDALDLKDKEVIAFTVWVSGVRRTKEREFYVLILRNRKNGKKVGAYSELGGLDLE